MIQMWTLMFSNYNFLRRFAIHRDFYQHSRWYTTRDMVSERQAKVRFCHISSKCMVFFSYVPVLLSKKGLYHRNLWPKLAYYPYLAHDRSILRGYKPTLHKMQCLQFENFQKMKAFDENQNLEKKFILQPSFFENFQIWTKLVYSTSQQLSIAM